MDTTVYVVEKGDTLSEIAKKFGISVKAIADFNGIDDPDVIATGQILRIPLRDPGEGMFKTYTIQSGDTLLGIARMFGTDVNTLARLNGIPNPDLIEVGRVIRVPADTLSDRVYIVQSGDTLFDIANMHGTTVETLADLNGIVDPGYIEAGQVIRLPSENFSNMDITSYTVRSGDTLWKISRRFGVRLVDLINLNQLTNPDLIYPGQILVIR